MQRSRAVKIGAAVILVIALAVGLWYRRGLSLYQLESDPCDFSNVSYQVFFNGDRQSLEVSGGLAYNHIFEGVGQLNFHRAASNLIARPLGLWHQPPPDPPDDGYSFTLEFGSNGNAVLCLYFSGGRWYYQTSEMAGLLPCAVQPDGTQAGEALGALLWEMTPIWEKYGYES